MRGRVCLGLRLDWDLDSSKETSDIYIKFRLIMLAITLVPFVYLKYLIHRSPPKPDFHENNFRVRAFVAGFCLSNRSHANLGGR